MKIELNIPESLGEIELRTYKKFLADTKDKDVDYTRNKMVEYFCGVNLQETAQLKATYIDDIIVDIDKLFHNVELPLVTRFKLGNQEFGFIPNLEEISLGEYIDLDKYITDFQSMNKAMAVLYRPIVKKDKKDKTYSIEQYNGSITYSEVMEFAPMDVVFSALFFFKSLEKELLSSTVDFLEREKKEEMKTLVAKLNLEKSGGGIAHYMGSVKEMLDTLKR